MADKGMAYTLHAFIGKFDTIKTLSNHFNNATLVELGQGFGLIPLHEGLFNEICQEDEAEHSEGFERLNDKVESSMLGIIGLGKLAYVEAEFFGGDGGHTGVVWNDGERVFQVAFHANAMNEILAHLGVARQQGMDEFDTLGLGQHRNTENWF